MGETALEARQKMDINGTRPATKLVKLCNGKQKRGQGRAMGMQRKAKKSQRKAKGANGSKGWRREAKERTGGAKGKQK